MDETMLGGRYRRVRPLGRGAMGEVWLAEDSLLHRKVAVKSVSSAIPAEPADLQRVIREARFAAQLNHPHAVAVYDVIVVEERPYVVMEFVSGRSLAEQIAAESMAAPEVGRIGIAVAEALAEAHQIGLVHRDVKPANIMITERGLPKIADFGIARLANDVDGSITGVTIGTPAYLAPELARGGAADPRSDIWALGVTLYAALDNGRSPFQTEGDNAFTVIARLATNPVPPEPARGAALTPTVMRMLAADPARRPDAGTVVDMLRSDLAAGRATHQWALPAYALAPPMEMPGPVDPPPTDRLPPAPPAPPPYEPPPETPRDPMGLFGDDDWDDPSDRTGRYGAVRTAPGRPKRRRRAVLAAVLALVLVAAGATGVALWVNRDKGGGPSAGPVASGGTSRSATPTSPTTPSGTPYTGAGGITVYGPPGWRSDHSAGIDNVDDYLVPGSTKHNDSTFFRVGIGNPRPTGTFDEQVQEELDYLTGPKNAYQDLQLIGAPKRLTFLGVPAADFEYTGTFRNETARSAHRHVLLRIWTQGGVQREILLVAIAAEWNTYKGVFAQLVASARVD